MNVLVKEADEKFCTDCGSVIKLKAEICPKCGIRQTGKVTNINL
jgi:RNA polymerase subunit RPABC4/transcription elongation factor Spt4